MPPVTLLHASVGTIAILAGAAALSLRKGERAHKAVGTVFFLALAATATTGAYLGFATDNVNNAIAGVMTLYLVLTAWMAARRPEGRTGLFELAAFLVAAGGAAIGFYFAFAAMAAGRSTFGWLPYLIIASIAALAALLDLSVILRRGLRGRQRVARQVWRMTLGFSAAIGSFFPGQIQIFPEAVQQIRPFILLFIPFFIVVGLTVFWSLYVLLTRRFATQT